MQHVRRTAVQGDPASVLAAMDEFVNWEWMMSIEPAKRKSSDKKIAGLLLRLP